MDIIYKTTNQINGKIYIGQHVTDVPTYLGSGIYLNRAIKKYGKESFKREILEDCTGLTQSQLDDMEIYYIAKLDARNPKIGYNIAYGGQGGKLTPEIIEKIINTKRKNGTLNHSEETKRKIAEANTGKIHSEETKKKLSIISKGRFTYDRTEEINKKVSDRLKLMFNNLSSEERLKIYGNRKGILHSKETKNKMSKSQKNRKPITEETRKRMVEAAKLRHKLKRLQRKD